MTDHSRHLGQGKFNEAIDADQLVDEIGLDAEELEWRKEYIEFDEEDVERLERFEDVFLDHADEVADSFYDHLTDYEETMEIFDRSPKSVDQLKLAQQAYLTTLASGRYDEEYFRNRARIGKLHDRLEMPMKLYLGQYNVYYSLLLSLVTDRIYDRIDETVETTLERAESDDRLDPVTFTQRIYDDVETGIDELHSILKLLNLDMQVAVDTYIQSYAADVSRERDRFAALFENVPTPVAVVRLTEGGNRDEVEQVNTAFEQLFGYTAADLADEPFEELLQPDDATQRRRVIEGWSALEDLELGAESELDEVELTLETEFGQREFVRVSAPVDRSGFENYEYVFYIDVTDEKQRQQRLQVLSRVLRHDIRTQTNLIQGYASSITDADEETRSWMADQIESASEELLETSERIRKVESLVAGEADRQPIDVEAMVVETLEEVREEFPDCEFTLSTSESLEIAGTDSLRIALWNVIENGAEHNDAAEPAVDVEIGESLDGDHVDVRVADNGPGIPPAEYEVLTGDRELSQTEHTSGIGLWTVNWIVTNLGGTLQFDSNMPRGSIVTVRLPRASPE